MPGSDLSYKLGISLSCRLTLPGLGLRPTGAESWNEEAALVGQAFVPLSETCSKQERSLSFSLGTAPAQVHCTQALNESRPPPRPRGEDAASQLSHPEIQWHPGGDSNPKLSVLWAKHN